MHKNIEKRILKKVVEDYDQIADDFSNTRNYIGRDFDQFKKYIKNGQSVLDLGCGNGRLLQYFQRLVEEKEITTFHYIGMDNSINMLETAKKRNQNANSLFMEGDQLKIPMTNNAVDIIFNIRAFHHLPSLKTRLQSLKEMSRVTKKNGIIVITVWNLWQKNYYKPIINAIFKSLITFGTYRYNDTFISFGKHVKRYYHAFTEHELRKLIQKSGLELLSLEKTGHDFAIVLKNGN